MAQRRARQKAADLVNRQQAKDAKDEPPCAGCLRGIPWVLTCGYCCGTFGDAFTTNRQLNESAGEAERKEKKKGAVVVGQPVFEDDGVDVVGTEHVVAVSIPLLAVC